jgi:Ca-activated chloride channel family protein
MKQPQIDLLPLRPAVRAEAATVLDVLVKITLPVPDAPVDRPPINLGLVLDHSESMAGRNKIDFARQAAVFAVQQLLPTDRVSVTIFDGEVETIAPNAAAEEKGRLVDLIQRVEPRGGTALHGGWKEGGQQVAQHLLQGGLNRVLLLSDGQANVGETNPEAIVDEVRRLASEGVGTTAMGLGDDYNEDLLEAMARGGDGNYYYIESPVQLADVFQTELRGLMATVGKRVSLGLEPQDGVTVLDVLNELDSTPRGRLKLPNLVAGMPLLVVVRLQIRPRAHDADLCRFRLAWDPTEATGRQQLFVTLRLPALEAAAWDRLTSDAEVWERATLLLMARYKKEASRCLEQGDRDEAARWLGEAERLLAAAPATTEMLREAQALAELQADLAAGTRTTFTKRAKYQAHQRTRSLTYTL